MGQFDLALGAYDQALRGDLYLEDSSLFSTIHVNKSAVLWRLERYGESIEEANNAITIKPDLADAWYNRGLSYLAIRNYRQATLDFQDAIRDKLNSFKLNDEELIKCLEWIPPTKTSLNVIVIPDLSRRITDTINNPNQLQNDKFILNTVWKSFVEHSKLKQDSKDRLMVDVTDIDQAKGQFSSIANKLQFDLSSHKGKSNRLYFTNDKNKQFTEAIDNLYNSAKEKPLGADYIFYFRRYLINHLKKPTLYDNYINKVIIITDGYLELEKNQDYGNGNRWN
jgi:tetratricopeptide (TPR) repeat protein